MNQATIKPIKIALGAEIHTHAQEFARQQNTIEKGKQVYFNALAIYAVHNYLKWLKIESSLESSDSWQPGIQSISNNVDLLIPEVGRLECYYILPQDTELTISPQGTENRLGYVVVKFEENLDTAQLIGFLPAISPSTKFQRISLTQLHSLELLLDVVSSPIAIEKTESESQLIINLNQWLSGIFETEWLSLEDLFASNFSESIFALRETPEESQEEANNESNLPIQIRRGKIIDLGVRLGGETVALVVNCTPTATSEIDILIQVYPSGKEIYLPANLELKVLDENKILIPELQVKARIHDNCIQLSFTGVLGEKFSATLTLGEISITENFQI